MRAEIVLKAFLSGLPEEKQSRLLQFLSDAERARLEQIPSIEKRESFRPILEIVHWSWFIPTLKTYSEREQRLFLKGLPSSARENLQTELTLSPTEDGEIISSIAISFLRQVLLNSLTGAHDRLLPVEFLPPSPLKPLLSLSKKELIRLIDFLSLRDLSSEMRQIVETKILKRIYSFLSKEERELLQKIMVHPEPFYLPRLNLDKWEGDRETFRHLLHRRGLARLGLALSGQDPDLIWYLCHQLDIGRGNALFKLCDKEPAPAVSEQMIQQIKEFL